MKGYKNVVLDRETARFASQSLISKQFRDRIQVQQRSLSMSQGKQLPLQNMNIPDESYFNTMASIDRTQIPWNWTLFQNTPPNHTCARFSIWQEDKNKSCHGRYVRDICNLSVGDLSLAHASGCLIANKFDLDVSSCSVICHLNYVMDKSKIT